MKKFMATTLGALLLTALIIPTMQVEAKEPFSDLEGIGAKNDILYLYEKNIIGGFEDGTFKPNQPITRAQVSSMLVKAMDYELIESPTVNFKDVTNQSGYYKILATISEKGILRGDNGYMRPNEPTTRGQMAAVLRRAFDLPLEKQATFVDVSPLNGFSSDINSIAKNRITGGYPDGTYKPANAVTRAQFSSFLVRALDDKMKVSSYKSYIGQKGTEIEQDGWLYTIKNNKLLKINQKTKEEVVLLSKTNFSYIDALYQVRLQDGFPIVLYNNELFIPYWSSVGEATDLPLSYGLMKTSTNGGKYEEIDLQGRKFNSGTNRNVYVWNDRIYYTAETKRREPSSAFDETVNMDEPLYFYSVNLNGSDPKLEATIDARVIFEEVGGYAKEPIFSQYNKSIQYDHSAMYYFNKKGVFKYNLMNGKSTRLTSVQAKDMIITGTGIDIVDIKGKKHTLKK